MSGAPSSSLGGPRLAWALVGISLLVAGSGLVAGVAWDQLAAPGADPRLRWLSEGLASLAAAALGGIWVWRRVAAPMAAAQNAALAFMHGDSSVRADGDQGSRDARELARTVNALIEHTDKMERRGRDEIGSGVLSLSEAARQMGQGDLDVPVPDVAEGLSPVAEAMETARVQLSSRLADLHREASDVALGAARVASGARRVGHGALEQSEVMHRIGKHADVAHSELEAQNAELESGLSKLVRYASDSRKLSQQHRAELALAARRARDLRGVIDRLEKSLANLSLLEDCIQLLEEFRNHEREDPEQSEGGKVLSTRAALAIRRGREAVEAIRRDMSRVSDDTTTVARALETIASAGPTLEPQLERGVRAALHESGLAFLRVSERLMDGVRGLERSVTKMDTGADEVFSSAVDARTAAPRLGLALAELRLGGHLESDVLDRLEQARGELESPADDGLSKSGQAMVEEVARAAEEARMRLSRLMAATEATLEVMRRA